MSLLQNSNAVETGGYNIANSLRFQSASSTYLARTPASAGNLKTWTWSGWVKRGQLSSSASFCLFSSYTNDSNRFAVTYLNDTLRVENVVGGSAVSELRGTPVFRDPSAWYHVVIIADTTNATASNRYQIYVNNVLQTAFVLATYPALNADLQLNGAYAHNIGRQLFSTPLANLDGYLTEVNFIDGQALTPSSFGETNTLTGQWVAKKYTGTYGTNGFYLPFSNGTSTTTLGADGSGNSNNWTLNNFTRSAGTSDCWMYDVPSGNGSQAGGTQPNSNYPVFNPIDGQSIGLQLSNLYSTPSQSRYTKSTLAIPSSGKWYAEFTINSTAQNLIGISAMLASNANNLGYDSKQICYQWNGAIIREGSSLGSGATITTNDVLALAVNADTKEISFYKNGTVTGITVSYSSFGTEMFFAFGTYFAGAAAHVNFGQRSFAYTPPSGFKALCTANLPASTIVKGNQFMDATLYTGNGGTQTIVNAGGFSPDIVWIKTRSMPYNNLLHDSVRGVLNLLIPNGTDAEQSVADGITSFNSNGFTLGANGSYNQNTRTIVAWQWDAGSSTVTNTSGTISSQVRANPTAGVSIVTFTATGANSTVGHGLGVAPKMVITKSRNNTFVWYTWHTALAGNEYLELSTTVAKGTSTGLWNSTIPTSSVLSFGTSYPSGTNLVAYCFAEIAGFSKFGSYTGNGSADGVFVYTGFRPKYVMIKRTDTTGNWAIHDTSRSPFNQIGDYLLANTADAEVGGSVLAIDALSNGFKLRVTQANENASGGTYIYACFAESPFASSNAR